VLPRCRWCSGPGRKCDHRIRGQHIDAAKPTADRATRRGTPDAWREWVLATGIEDDETKALGRFDQVAHTFE